jgi:hypothetical protein
MPVRRAASETMFLRRPRRNAACAAVPADVMPQQLTATQAATHAGAK